MKVDLLYEHKAGRGLMKFLMKSGILKPAAWFLKTKPSKLLIGPYIKSNSIDMSPFQGQKYDSFAEFFARKKEETGFDFNENDMLSPCDGLFSIYPIEEYLEIPVKGSRYVIEDFIPDHSYAEKFAGGLCLVFRLEASDYHHFCYFDDCLHCETHFIEGELHSVQPIAVRQYPVYRLNRRWWTKLYTKHFGHAAQIEVGAVLVGGVTHVHEGGYHHRGEEMGNFELCGSTILLMLPAHVRTSLVFHKKVQPAWNGEEEVRVKMGESIGYLR